MNYEHNSLNTHLTTTWPQESSLTNCSYFALSAAYCCDWKRKNKTFQCLQCAQKNGRRIFHSDYCQPHMLMMSSSKLTLEIIYIFKHSVFMLRDHFQSVNITYYGSLISKPSGFHSCRFFDFLRMNTAAVKANSNPPARTGKRIINTAESFTSLPSNE